MCIRDSSYLSVLPPLSSYLPHQNARWIICFLLLLFVCLCMCVRVCFVFCLVSVLVSCSFTCYTMLVLLMYPPTVISYSYTCHCMAYTCIYIYFAIVIYISNVVKVKKKKIKRCVKLFTYFFVLLQCLTMDYRYILFCTIWWSFCTIWWYSQL